MPNVRYVPGTHGRICSGTARIQSDTRSAAGIATPEARICALLVRCSVAA
ncbi:Uncharacterised protein [Mycobacterium tuberculosis]|nr:Uncharacterised protein [Mycobacterium tuberculosis]